MLTRPMALVLVALVWAAIYLPALGTLEIKGEEGRRILPAVSMLETGNWIVPHVGGEPYLSKPPLINWLVALACKVSGTQSEWAARAPSVLAMLALGLGVAWRGGGVLGTAGGFVAAVFVLTNVGMMEKGRLAEIEALYVACFGLALTDWLASWKNGAGPWRTWLLPGVFLGLGLLTKGPLLLMFFYGIVIAVLWRAGRLRELAHPAAGAGLALAVGMFLAWAVPYWAAAPPGKVSRAWSAQFTGRLRAEGGFRFSSWVQNIPRGLFNFLPWAVFLPRLWRGPRLDGVADDAILRGGRVALTGCFLLVSLIPGGLPRYTLPLVVPAALWLALRLTRDHSAEPAGIPAGGAGGQGWWASPVRLALGVAALMAGITWVYALVIVPKLLRREGLRPLAARVNASAGESGAFVLAPGYQPFLFYLNPSPRYVLSLDEVPVPAPGGKPCFLLVKEETFTAAGEGLRRRGALAEPILTVDEKNRGRYRLLSVGPAEPSPGGR